MSRTFFLLIAGKGSKATHEGHLLPTWQHSWNVSEPSSVPGSGDSRDVPPPQTISVKSIKLWGKATPGFLSAQTRGFTEHWRLKCITRLYVCVSIVCACVFVSSGRICLWMDGYVGVSVYVCVSLDMCMSHACVRICMSV